MFENIRLFTKRDNKISDPNPSWDTQSRIHCSCELNTGLGNKLIWTPGNTIPLHNLIEFYNGWYDASVTVNGNFQYAFSNGGATITILYNTGNVIIRYKHHNIDDEVLRKGVWAPNYKDEFYCKVMSILTQHTNTALCMKVGQLFFKKNNHEHQFEIGQRVKTILNNNVKTERVGYILHRGYHFNDSTNLYFLMINGEKYSKRYLPADLEKI
ncbi:MULTISPECIES: hypothetical protein [Niastella]|uniref:Uncharacterized protein n=1 Tax=Niastella soli TaxID=2821487 RepID=A0ABS3YZH9_9BACT|nr:hypothetical protein [Niastella soli]MBO9203331.1 hypothetical protein [Niastella soli]